MNLLDRPVGTDAEPCVTLLQQANPATENARRSPPPNVPSWSRLETVAKLLHQELRLFDSEPIIRGDKNSERRLLAMSHVLQAGAMLRERFARVPYSDDIDGISLRYSLTKRQSDVLSNLLFGMSEKEIAATLALSKHTVHQHIKTIYRVTMVRSRSELMARFLRDEFATMDGATASDASARDARKICFAPQSDGTVVEKTMPLR